MHPHVCVTAGAEAQFRQGISLCVNVSRADADGRLKVRLRPMRGVKTDRTASVVMRGRAFVQHLRRGRDELGVDASPVLRLAAAFDDLQFVIRLILPPPAISHALRSPDATTSH